MVWSIVLNALDRSKYTDEVDSLVSSDVHIYVTNFVTASMVLCFCRKPNLLSISILFSSRKKCNLLCTIFSSNLDIEGSNEMGL